MFAESVIDAAPQTGPYSKGRGRIFPQNFMATTTIMSVHPSVRLWSSFSDNLETNRIFEFRK